MNRRKFLELLTYGSLGLLLDNRIISKEIVIKDLISSKKIPVYLTVDDGPTKNIIYFLNPNDKNKYSFFMIGKHIELYNQLRNRDKELPVLESLLEKGHIIGNHTYSHKKFSSLYNKKLNEEKDANKALNSTLKIIKEDIEKAHELIIKIYNNAGIREKEIYFRYPYEDTGYIKINNKYFGNKELKIEIEKFIRRLGYKIAFWNIDTEDWRYYHNGISKEKVKELLLKAKKGDIILMHDMPTSKKSLIPYLIDIFSKEYKSLSLSEKI